MNTPRRIEIITPIAIIAIDSIVADLPWASLSKATFVPAPLLGLSVYQDLFLGLFYPSNLASF